MTTTAPDHDRERRARLLAEQELQTTKSQLWAANRKIAAQALHLADDVKRTRSEAAQIREEADCLRGNVIEVSEHLIEAETAMEIAQKRLWSSIDSIRDGFAVFCPDKTLIAANKAYIALFEGLDHVTAGAAYEDLLSLLVEEGLVDTEGASPQSWRTAMLSRWDADRIEPCHVKLWNEQTLRLVERRTSDGDVVVLALNVTDQMTREARMSEARDRAEAANRAKSAFLANMSHEIKTPMNGVIAMAELLAETDLSDEQRDYLDTIRTSGEALLVIINDVLDYSKIEAEKLSFKSKPFDLERCIHEVVSLLTPAAQEKSLQIAVDYDLFLPTSFVGDAGRVRQVLTNLIGNAIKFTDDGHIAVRVVGLPGEEARNFKVHLLVEDTGVGIPEDKLDVIFGEFQQVEDDQNRAYDGTGLGLAISKKLVELMGGEIWVESKPGVGSGFGFHLTLASLEDTTLEDVTAPHWLGRAIILAPEGPNRSVLKKQLELLGLNCRCVETDDDLAKLSLTSQDILFADATRPGADPGAPLAALAHDGTAGLFLLTDRPLSRNAVPEGARTIKRPVLRADLVSILQDLRPPLPSDVAAHPETESPAVGRPDDTPGRAMRILVAEDNRTNRFVFQKMVKDLDIDLVFAENGEEAVKLYTEQPPDLFFTDISMPKMDGKEATRRIRAMEQEHSLPHCPIVAVTAHSHDDDGSDVISAGCDHFLPKPLKKRAILDHVLDAHPLHARPVMADIGVDAADIAAAADPSDRAAAAVGGVGR